MKTIISESICFPFFITPWISFSKVNSNSTVSFGLVGVLGTFDVCVCKSMVVLDVHSFKRVGHSKESKTSSKYVFIII